MSLFKKANSSFVNIINIKQIIENKNKIIPDFTNPHNAPKKPSKTPTTGIFRVILANLNIYFFKFLSNEKTKQNKMIKIIFFKKNLKIFSSITSLKKMLLLLLVETAVTCLNNMFSNSLKKYVPKKLLNKNLPKKCENIIPKI